MFRIIWPEPCYFKYLNMCSTLIHDTVTFLGIIPLVFIFKQQNTNNGGEVSIGTSAEVKLARTVQGFDALAVMTTSLHGLSEMS